MKVLVVGTGGSIVGGITTAADEMVNALRTLGHEAERLNAGERLRRPNRVNAENVSAVLADARAVYRRARESGSDVVWIHAFGLPVLPALRALALVSAARLAGRRAVVHFHAFALETLVAGGGRVLRFLLQLLARRATFVVVHEKAAEALDQVTKNGAVHVLPNWVDVPDEAAPLPPQPPLKVVFVGGLIRRKGVPQLLDAMRTLERNEAHLMLVGGAGEDGPEALERLRAGAEDVVAAGRVIFGGIQDAAGVRTALRRAHLLVLPSEAEGMPIAMLEAMAEGRAVLVTDAGNMGLVVDQAQCGWLLPDRSPQTISATLRRLAREPGEVAAAAGRARQAATERFSVHAQRRTMEAILESVLTSNPGR